MLNSKKINDIVEKADFFDFLKSLGIDFNLNPSSLSDENREKIYQEMIAWPEYIKQRINILLLLAVFGQIDSRIFEEEKLNIINCANSVQNCFASGNLCKDMFTSVEKEKISISLNGNSKLASLLESIDFNFVCENIPAKGFKTDYTLAQKDYMSLAQEFNEFIDEIVDSPLGEENISELREFIGRIDELHGRFMNITNIFDNYLLSNRKEEDKSEVQDYSLENLATMTCSVDFSNRNIDQIFTKLIKYSNYTDEQFIEYAKKEKINIYKYKPVRYKTVFKLLSGFYVAQSLVINDAIMSYFSVISQTKYDVISSIEIFKIVIGVIVYCAATGLFIKLDTYDAERIVELFNNHERINILPSNLAEEANMAALIQSGKSTLNDEIRKLKLLDK